MLVCESTCHYTQEVLYCLSTEYPVVHLFNNGSTFDESWGESENNRHFQNSGKHFFKSLMNVILLFLWTCSYITLRESFKGWHSAVAFRFCFFKTLLCVIFAVDVKLGWCLRGWALFLLWHLHLSCTATFKNDWFFTFSFLYNKKKHHQSFVLLHCTAFFFSFLASAKSLLTSAKIIMWFIFRRKPWTASK